MVVLRVDVQESLVVPKRVREKMEERESEDITWEGRLKKKKPVAMREGSGA